MENTGLTQRIILRAKRINKVNNEHLMQHSQQYIYQSENVIQPQNQHIKVISKDAFRNHLKNLSIKRKREFDAKEMEEIDYQVEKLFKQGSVISSMDLLELTDDIRRLLEDPLNEIIIDDELWDFLQTIDIDGFDI